MSKTIEQLIDEHNTNVKDKPQLTYEESKFDLMFNNMHNSHKYPKGVLYTLAMEINENNFRVINNGTKLINDIIIKY